MEKTANIPEFPLRAMLLAQPGFFQNLFIAEKVIFGEMQVGEGVTHGVAVHLEQRGLFCTCPFRPKPCTHALALQALFLREGEAFFNRLGKQPEWIVALLGGQPAATAKHISGIETSVAAKQKARFERLERAANGFEDLEAWLLDTARRGLAAVVAEDPQWYEGIASRMADASMTGISRTLRLLGQIPASTPDWAAQVASVLADCYLAVRAFRKRDTLSEQLLLDLQTFIGIAAKKEGVLATGERLSDAWAVLSQREERVEDKLSARRTWLLGGHSSRYALLLDYSFGGDGFPPGFEPGSIEQGTLAFWPSAFPLRALVADNLVRIPQKVGAIPGFAEVDAFAASWASALAKHPWLQVFPAAFSGVVPLMHGAQFFMVDHKEQSLRLNVEKNTGWRLLALSAGRPIDLFGEWDGLTFKPLSVAAERRFVVL